MHVSYYWLVISGIAIVCSTLSCDQGHRSSNDCTGVMPHSSQMLLQTRSTRSKIVDGGSEGRSLDSTTRTELLHSVAPRPTPSESLDGNAKLMDDNIVELLQKPKCRNFFGNEDTIGLPPSPTIVDPVTQTFRPATELAGVAADEPTLPAVAFQRMLTFEDVAFPHDFHSDFIVGTGGTRKDFAQSLLKTNPFSCEMFAIRTPQRPVKVISAQGKRTLTMPAIWKVATTSLVAMLKIAEEKGSVKNIRGPHFNTSCSLSNRLDQCEKITSFQKFAVDADIKVAIVRNPLDRFLASVKEHFPLPTCTINGTAGQLCHDWLARAKLMAFTLANDFPHKYRSCEHASQVYFLSATDLQGKPLVWDRVMRLEAFDDALNELHKMTGIQLTARNENSSGDAKLKKMYFDAVFSDLRTLCSICRVYAQDFACLGYDWPESCTPEKCVTVGVSLIGM